MANATIAEEPVVTEEEVFDLTTESVAVRMHDTSFAGLSSFLDFLIKVDDFRQFVHGR